MTFMKHSLLFVCCIFFCACNNADDNAGNQQYQFLEMTEKPSAANNWTPGFTFPLNNGERLSSTFEDYISSSSRWSMQFGVKYMFN